MWSCACRVTAGLVSWQERTYSLSVVDEDSKTATVSVSLNVAPPTEVTLSAGGQEVKGVPVFDSDRMPVVNVG